MRLMNFGPLIPYLVAAPLFPIVAEAGCEFVFLDRVTQEREVTSLSKVESTRMGQIGRYFATIHESSGKVAITVGPYSERAPGVETFMVDGAVSLRWTLDERRELYLYCATPGSLGQ